GGTAGRRATRCWGGRWPCWWTGRWVPGRTRPCWTGRRSRSGRTPCGWRRWGTSRRGASPSSGSGLAELLRCGEGEVLRVLPPHVAEEVGDAGEVGREVAGEGERGAGPDPLVPVVERDEDDGDADGDGDVVEAGLPARGAAARALGRDAEHERLAARERLDGLGDEAAGAAAVHGDAAE